MVGWLVGTGQKGGLHRQKKSALWPRDGRYNPNRVQDICNGHSLNVVVCDRV